MTAGPRRLRVANGIRDHLSELIPAEVSDPRVTAAGIASVNLVELNRDMSVAEVFISFIGADEQASAAAVKALGQAVGFLRGPLSKRLGMAKIPTLRFNLDKSAEMQAKLTDIVRDDAARTVEEDDE